MPFRNMAYTLDVPSSHKSKVSCGRCAQQAETRPEQTRMVDRTNKERSQNKLKGDPEQTRMAHGSQTRVCSVHISGLFGQLILIVPKLILIVQIRIIFVQLRIRFVQLRIRFVQLRIIFVQIRIRFVL